MTRCMLGEKKRRKLALILGKPIETATVRGGEGHRVHVRCVGDPPTISYRVDLKTGKYETYAENVLWVKEQP